jgi:hypothetical protein
VPGQSSDRETVFSWTNACLGDYWDWPGEDGRLRPPAAGPRRRSRRFNTERKVLTSSQQLEQSSRTTSNRAQPTADPISEVRVWSPRCAADSYMDEAPPTPVRRRAGDVSVRLVQSSLDRRLTPRRIHSSGPGPGLGLAVVSTTISRG